MAKADLLHHVAILFIDRFFPARPVRPGELRLNLTPLAAMYPRIQ
jgi:hypothetical protein